jgi:hypothetical protein
MYTSFLKIGNDCLDRDGNRRLITDIEWEDGWVKVSFSPLKGFPSYADAMTLSAAPKKK